MRRVFNVNLRAWQLTFLCAVTALILSAAIVFSVHWATITGVIVIIYTVLNLFLGGNTSQQAAGSQIIVKMRQSLNVPKYLVAQTLFTFLAVGLIWTYKLYDNEQKKKNPPVKMYYRVFRGNAIDFLAKGDVSNKVDKTIQGIPTIINNQTLKDLALLAETFSRSLEDDRYYFYRSSERVGDTNNDLEALFNANRRKRFFVGSTRPWGRIEKQLSQSGVQSLINTDAAWRISFFDGIYDEEEGHDDEKLLGSAFFWRFANRDDVKSFLDDLKDDQHRMWLKFYLHVTQNNLPPDFCAVIAYPTEVNCGDDEELAEIVAELYFPLLEVRVAVVENPTSAPMRIGKLAIKKHISYELRKYESEVGQIASATAVQEEPYGNRILKPSEQLIIPVEIIFTHGSEPPLYALPFSDSAPKMRDKLSALLKKNKAMDLPFGSALPLGVKDALGVLSRPDSDIDKNKKFVYGAFTKIESIDVDEFTYPFKSSALDQVQLWSGGSETGSCPYIFTYSPSTKTWINQGHILYLQKGRHKESVDVKTIDNFDGRLLIKEIDPETSYIDFLHVKALLPDKRTLTLLPSVDKLNADDGKYLVLKQGEQLELLFNVPEEYKRARFSVVAKGFYVPYNIKR